jgi:hypothetical protein
MYDLRCTMYDVKTAGKVYIVFRQSVIFIELIPCAFLRPLRTLRLNYASCP